MNARNHATFDVGWCDWKEVRGSSGELLVHFFLDLEVSFSIRDVLKCNITIFYVISVLLSYCLKISQIVSQAAITHLPGDMAK